MLAGVCPCREPCYSGPFYGAVRTEKQITRGASEEIGDPPLRQMMRAIMEHVVAQPVVARTAGVATSDVDHHVIVLRRELPDLGSLALRPAG